MSAQVASQKKQQDLQTQYGVYKNTLQQIAQKIGDVEQEAEEHKGAHDGFLLHVLKSDLTPHAVIANFASITPLFTSFLRRLVLETLQPLSEDRKCFRLINGVLMEQTVKDVMPALTTNSEGLKKVLEDLVKQYKAKQDELEKWKKKNNVQVVQN
ncbi:prefoldin subunit [Colletotrichum orchidophilum]|uniref:Prefoldin subunit n=2 Tax=Colletotrichum TaxID=5455 RepID=A0A1G4B6S3_9PEZI|nr:prefoldin subunit [Colletotrichum orchidophilum]OHE96985.1 prefoldin subunit [Colletotrichum orchidophilum]